MRRTGGMIAFVLLVWSQAASSPAAPVLWVVDATRRVVPGDAPEASNRIWSSTRGEVRLRAARRESEGFHLVVTADAGGLTGVKVTATALTGAAGTISADRLHLYREAFFDVAEISAVEGHPRLGSTGPVPDALVPFVDPYGSAQQIGIPFDVAAGASQPIWVLVEVPANAAAGTYQGTLQLVRASNGTVLGSVTLVLEVVGVTLPLQPTFRALYNLDRATLLELHGNPTGAAAATLVRNALEELSRRRIAPGYAYPLLPSYDNTAGFDWSAAAAEWSWWLDTRASSVVNLPAIYDSATARYQIQDSGGQPYTVADLTPGSHFDLQARLYYQRLWNDLDSYGWLDRAVVYLESDDAGPISDEPYDAAPSTYDRVRAWADILHHPDPADPGKRLPFVVAGDSLYPSAPYADLRGHADIWDHYMDEIDHNADAYAARRAAYPEEELWLVPNSYGDFIDYPALHHRCLGFFAWKTGATGLEHWDSTAWYDVNEQPASPWYPASLTPVWGWGGGAELWPGHDIEQRGISINGPLPSLRLELNRQAFEDYEYLSMLDDLGLGELATALATAAIPTPLWPGLGIDRDQYGRCRAAASDAIVTGSVSTRTVTGTVSDLSAQPIAGALVGDGTYAALTADDGTFSLTLPDRPGMFDVTAAYHLPATRPLTGTGAAVIGVNLTPLATSVTGISGSFEAPGDLWQGDGATVSSSTQHVTDGAKSMRVVFLDSASEAVVYPAITAWPGDWSGYDMFELDVYNASSWYCELDLEIFDSSGGATIELFFLNPGEAATLRLPIASFTSDPADVDWLEIYADSPGRGDREIFFDHLRLTEITGTDTVAPGAPAGLTATTGNEAYGQQQPWVELTWTEPTTDVSGGAATGVWRYQVLRGPAGQTPGILLNQHQVVTDPTYRDREVRSGETWVYAVRAVDQAGNVGPASPPEQVIAGTGLFADGFESGNTTQWSASVP